MEFEPPCGALLVTPREAYMHCGIYVGYGRVVHYAGFARGFFRKAGPVEEVSMAEFSKGRGCWMKSAPQAGFERPEIVARARSRIGEDRYRALRHNCVHFCHWCLFGEPDDSRWQRWLTGPRTAIELLRIRALQIVGGADPRYTPVLPAEPAMPAATARAVA